MSWNVWNRSSGSFTVDMGISSNIMKSPSPKCYMTFWDMTIYNDTLNWSDITPICELITELDFITDFDLFTYFGGFHKTLQRVRLANRGRLLLWTPGPVPFGTCICSNVETILSWIVMCTDLLSIEHPSVLLFCLLDVPVGFVTPSLLEAVYCFICGRRMLTIARYRMVCLVLTFIIRRTNVYLIAMAC